jgi:glycosyltransferase involved in cell wall biosynthesis
MHVAVDSVGAKHSGGAEVLLGLLRSAMSDPRLETVTVFSSPPSLRRFQLPASPKIVERPQPLAETAAGRIYWYEWGLARAARTVGADVLLCLNGAGLGPRDIPKLALVQQSLGFASEALGRLGFRERARVTVHHALMRRGCRSAERVFAQTNTMRDWIERDFGIPGDSVEVVTPPAPSLPRFDRPAPELEPMRQSNPHGRLLYVGSTVGYKNLGAVLDALPRIHQELPEATLFLTAEASGHFRLRERGVSALGNLPRAALREAYELSTLFVMPSLVETVGLPLLEAMSCGTPVLAADRPYAREVCGSAAAYFDPLVPNELARSAVRLLKDPHERSELRRLGLERAGALERCSSYVRVWDAVCAAAPRISRTSTAVDLE